MHSLALSQSKWIEIAFSSWSLTFSLEERIRLILSSNNWLYWWFTICKRIYAWRKANYIKRRSHYRSVVSQYFTQWISQRLQKNSIVRKAIKGSGLPEHLPLWHVESKECLSFKGTESSFCAFDFWVPMATNTFPPPVNKIFAVPSPASSTFSSQTLCKVLHIFETLQGIRGLNALLNMPGVTSLCQLRDLN